MIEHYPERQTSPGEIWNFNSAPLWLCYPHLKVPVVPDPIAIELDVLKEKLLIMAGYAEAAVNRAVKALVRRDDDLARQTREEDDLIDELELEVDDIALRLLARKPDALELRFITMAMKRSSRGADGWASRRRAISSISSSRLSMRSSSSRVRRARSSSLRTRALTA